MGLTLALMERDDGTCRVHSVAETNIAIPGEIRSMAIFTAILSVTRGDILLLLGLVVLVVFLIGVGLFYKILRGEEDEVWVLRLLE